MCVSASQREILLTATSVLFSEKHLSTSIDSSNIESLSPCCDRSAIAFHSEKHVNSKTWLSASLRTLISIYQTYFSPHFGGACRFEPSCSVYAEKIALNFDFFSAVRLIFQRLIKCRPGGEFGFDPPPEFQQPSHGRFDSAGLRDI
jgi:uncharacterized protein